MLDEKRDALAKHTIACFGPVTADGARQRGVHADIVSEQYSSFEFFIEAMERYFAG
jgi:uroporphyrinogen-III synthase